MASNPNIIIRAAGIMFIAGDSVLFLRRCAGGDHPGEWCFPGGKMEAGETAELCAVRETEEEAGVEVDPAKLRLWTRSVMRAEPIEAIDDTPVVPGEDVDFTTFAVRLSDQFTPTIDPAEHDGYAWAPIAGAPQPLHPGAQIALDRLDMDELGMARAMAAGRLVSPQRYENVWLFAIRITGTGASYRHSREEFVWRDPSIYLNDEFLARCNGLSVIWEHPEKSLLNHKEFDDRAIGSVMLPYLRADRPDEVWGIAKIYDEEAAEEMRDLPMSTSPAVNFSDPSANERIDVGDGKLMLIEGKPSLLDHIAICPAGVWDKGGDPEGVESIEAVADSVILIAGPSRMDLLRAHVGALSMKAQLRASGF